MAQTQGVERRRAARAPSCIPVRDQSPACDTEALVLDLSTSGAFVRTMEVDPPGTEVALTLQSYAVGRDVKLGCEVVRIADAPFPGLGLRFLSMPSETRAWLHFYCAAFAVKKRVLMVDDDVDILRLSEKLFAKEGYKYIGVQVPFETEAFVARFDPHVIILDFMMPGLNGAEVAARLKQNPKTARIPIVFYSAADERKVRAAAGDVALVPKGTRPSVLVEKVRSLVASA